MPRASFDEITPRGGTRMNANKILTGDWIAQLKKLPEKSVQCVVTSPPYN